jgi:hypothetical protein
MDFTSGDVYNNFNDKKLHLQDKVPEDTKNSLAGFKVWSGSNSKTNSEQDPSGAS